MFLSRRIVYCMWLECHLYSVLIETNPGAKRTALVLLILRTGFSIEKHIPQVGRCAIFKLRKSNRIFSNKVVG